MNIEESGGFFTGLFAIFKFIFTWKGALVITILILMIVSIGATYQSIQQKSFEPLFKELGGRLLNFENKLYIQASEIEKQGGIKLEGKTLINKITYLFDIFKIMFNFFSSLWILYTLLLILYKISIFFSNNQPLVAGIIVLIIFILFEMVGSFVIVGQDLVISSDVSPLEKHLPLRGVIKTVMVIPYIVNPIYQNITVLESD